MFAFSSLFLLLGCYVIGSLPTSIILTLQMGLPDPRTYGSKNIGATNVSRKSIILGLSTFLLDIGKVYLAITLTVHLGYDASILPCVWLATLLGQTRSMFLQFTGGKGVSCFIGGMLLLYPTWVIPLATLAFITMLITQRVWCASLAAVIAACIASGYYALPTTSIVVIGLIALWIICLHRDNMMQDYTTPQDRPVS